MSKINLFLLRKVCFFIRILNVQYKNYLLSESQKCQCQTKKVGHPRMLFNSIGTKKRNTSGEFVLSKITCKCSILMEDFTLVRGNKVVEKDKVSLHIHLVTFILGAGKRIIFMGKGPTYLLVDKSMMVFCRWIRNTVSEPIITIMLSHTTQVIGIKILNMEQVC